LRYADAFRFPFENPRWVPNLLILAVANVVPLVGPMFALGYAARVMASVRGGAAPGTYHDLDFNQAGDYLLRGLKVFVVSFLLMLLFLPFYLLFFFGFFFLVPLVVGPLDASGDGAAGVAGAALGCLGGGFGVTLLLAFVACLLQLSVPLVLRASLHPQLGAVFSLSFVLDFVRRCWKQVLLCYLVFIAASIPISIAGLLLLVVGVLVASAYLQLVHAHLLAQLADLYEARGGESVAGAAPTTPTPPAPPLLPAT
jgi:hypothetical protein